MTFSLLQLLAIAGTAAVLGTVVGFVAGTLHGRFEFDRTLARAKGSLESLVNLLIRSIDHVERTGAAIQRSSDASTADHAERVERKRGGLLATLAGVVGSLRSRSARDDSTADTTNAAPRSKPKRSRRERFSIEWRTEPACERTGLPMRAAFEANVENLLEASARSDAAFGVMFVSVDKLGQLRTRFGNAVAERVPRTIGELVAVGVRDEDLVCRYDHDTFAVLLPQVSSGDVDAVARTVRDTLRQHRFHVDATGPEILVSTSLGVALCHPGENLPLLLGRVGEALRASRRRGRNQVHVHDGETMTRSTPA